jgi:hypothetical protein
MKRSIRLIAPAALGLTLWAAQPAPAPAADPGEVVANIINYIPNRICDIVHIFKIDLSWGKCAGVDVRATRMLEVGVSEYDVTRVGIAPDKHGLWDEMNDDKGVSLLGFELGTNEFDRDPYEIGATVHAFGGLEVGANLRSMLDALTGFFLIDLEDDDMNLFGGGGM